ncbi:MAG: imidazole glycerol phosphate synthase subunit HisH [Deltaproteobacteria bacterium]|nr:MAG: imidazole glycerol phosphate synthase subunit HisH [Deltaproteobacteria bacterium]
MPAFIAVVDYGRGNLRSVAKALETVGLRVRVTQSPKVIKDATALVVPGQGAFDDCMATLRDLHLLTAIRDSLRSGKPYLGICIGLQILYTESEEHGRHEGLGTVPGKVTRFPDLLTDGDGNRLKIPHMGWNQVRQVPSDAPLWKDIPDESFFYFVHSYYGIPDQSELVAGWTDYGVPFASAILHDNLFAVQFHPEKSQKVGLTLLRNFGNWVGKEVFTA